MHRFAWVLQVLVGLYFIFIGLMHFVVPAGLPEPLSWMYDLSSTTHAVAGVAEIAGGLGLILPGFTGIRPGLTVWAALGLIVVMISAAVWHFGREELVNVGTNALNIVVLAFIAYVRWRVAPLEPRSRT